MIGRMPWISQELKKNYIKKCPKNLKNDPFNRNKMEFSFFNSSMFYGTRFSQPKYQFLGEKL